MEQAQTILELWWIFRRRVWIITGISSVGILVSVFFAYVLPPIYQAQAKILVEGQQIPGELARSTVTGSSAERLQLIQQRLMTRDNLRRLIQDLNLFSDRPDLSVSEKIELLREATDIWPVAANAQKRGGGEISAFTINVEFNDPAGAARIANELVTTVLSQNIQARARRASETLDFFVNEEKRLAGKLAAVEAEITAFKTEHGGALPESLEFRRTQLSAAVENAQIADQRLLELEAKRGELEVALRRVAFAGAPAANREQQELQQLESEIAQKRSVYAENHHQIRALKAQIVALRASLPPSESGNATADLQEAELASIRNQVQILDSQVALLKEEKERLAKVRADLTASIRETPNVETILNALYRRQAGLQAQYGEIVRKRTEAETGEKLEVNQQAERYEVIETAIVPEEPISPDRKKVVMLGSAMSLALAAGIAFLIELLRPAIRSAAQMERKLELRPVAAIPYIWTRSERHWRTIRATAFVTLIVVGVPAALFAIDQYYMPLELIGTKIAEKTGLDETIRMVEGRL